MPNSDPMPIDIKALSLSKDANLNEVVTTLMRRPFLSETDPADRALFYPHREIKRRFRKNRDQMKVTCHQHLTHLDLGTRVLKKSFMVEGFYDGTCPQDRAVAVPGLQVELGLEETGGRSRS